MSQIDQAFIQAYAPEGAAAAYDGPPVFAKTPAGFAKTQADGARLKVHSQPVQRQPFAPHFPAYGASDPYVETAAMQQAATRVMPTATAAAQSRERRPLSSFSTHSTAMPQAFRPVFEVDSFHWPVATDELLEDHAELLIPVAEQLLAAGEEGRSLVGIVGTRPCVGTTTVHLCLARLMASAQKSVAIVDGNFGSRSLGRELGLECETGWESVLAGEAPLAESVVRSLGDGIALLPLVGHRASPLELLEGIQTSVTAGVLRYHYDIVLFDLGAAAREPQAAAARAIIENCRIEAGIVVADWSRCNPGGGAEVDRLMTLFGPTCLGLVGNQSLS